MNSLLAVIDNLFTQIKGYLSQIEEEQYGEKLEIFSGSSIGQHTRHIIEFFLCLASQLDSHVIDYDERERRKEIEEKPQIAHQELDRLSFTLSQLNTSSPLKLVTCYGGNFSEKSQIDTTLERELLYNIEHAVHHMAMIKIGLKQAAPQVVLPNEFGVAQSTLEYRNNIPSH